ncbi:MAG: hypothetical protein WCD70_14110 [Alphaproteobacteria bacterium]
MTRRNYSIDQLAPASVRQAQSEMAAMQSDLNKLRDSVSGLTRAIKAPVIKPPRTRTKKTTTTSLFGQIADFAVGNLLGETGLGGGSGGYTSAAQSAGSGLAMLALGQRIR